MKCQYCGTEVQKGLTMHERYCKSKPSHPSSNSITPASPDKSAEQAERIVAREDTLIMYWFKHSILTAPFRWIFSKRQTKPEHTEMKMEDILKNLPKWSIKERKPFFKPKNKNASWIQIVAFSRTRPPVSCWAEFDGVSVSVGDMFFPAPHDIRGEIFPYDMDKGIPLLENSDAFNDMSYWNKLVERVKNLYFTLGLVTGSGDFTKNIGLILLLVCVVGLLVIINIAATYQLTQGFNAANSQIGNITVAVKDYISTHP